MATKKKPSKKRKQAVRNVVHETRVPNISICIIAKNAANTITPLFNSLKEFADRGGDMVLVDTGSTDDTKVVYKAFGFRVFDVGEKFMIDISNEEVDKINEDAKAEGEKDIIGYGARLFNFSAARNFAASKAKNDYIINPDADEALTVFDIDKVELAFKTISRFQYDFVFSHNADGTPSVMFRTDTRASDRRFWKWSGYVHETNVAIAPNAVMAYVPPSVLKIEHFQAPAEHRSNYLPALAYACYKEPNNDRNLHYYARELMYRGYYKTAITKFRKHLEIGTYHLEKGQSLIFIGDCYKSLGDVPAMLSSWREALDLEPTRREGWMRMANYYFSQGNAHMTAACASAALALPWVDYYGNLVENYTGLPHHYLYWAFQKMGMQKEAQHHWTMALSYDPENTAYRYDAMFFRRKPDR
jgi:glycosyltransferase involved in cell wall biosynthesis